MLSDFERLWKAADDEARASSAGDEATLRAATRRIEEVARDMTAEYGARWVATWVVAARETAQALMLVDQARVRVEGDGSDQSAATTRPGTIGAMVAQAQKNFEEAARIRGESAPALAREFGRIVEVLGAATATPVAPTARPARAQTGGARSRDSQRQPTIAALRAMGSEQRRRALIGRSSRAHSRRMAQRGLAMGLRLLAGGVPR